MQTFILYWRDGKVEKVSGNDIAEAFTRAGYGAGALPAVDFYDTSPEILYTWNAQTRNWELIIPQVA